MRSGTSSALTEAPRSSPGRTMMDPVGSPRDKPSSVMSADAPMRRATSRNPHRVGLMPQSWIVSAWPLSSAAATKNAAEETSPGTTASNPGSCSQGARWRPLSFRSMRTPSALSILSVWSRDPIFPPILETPVARRAARRRQLFTCALGTGSSHEIGSRPPLPGKEAQGCELPRRPALDPCSHAAQRLDDPSHWPTDERIVTAQHREDVLPGKEPGEQPRRCAGVLRVQGPRRLGETAKPDSLDVDPVIGVRECHPE